MVNSNYYENGSKMKYKNFEQWYNCTFWNNDGLNDSAIARVKKFMRQAWDTAANNYPEDTTKADIIDLLNIVKGANSIKCVCLRGQLCNCRRSIAMKAATVDLSKYLRGLK